MNGEQAFDLMVKHNIIVIHCDRDNIVFTDDLRYEESYDGDKRSATLRLIERVARDRGEQL
ncbi:hypothetical protein CKS97_19980 [Salmonella enterica subsp. enterica serovar Java]|nr:hypothetical protein [Salmonella enterica subsp. enterica serovar Java]